MVYASMLVDGLLRPVVSGVFEYHQAYQSSTPLKKQVMQLIHQISLLVVVQGNLSYWLYL